MSGTGIFLVGLFGFLVVATVARIISDRKQKKAEKE